MATKRRSSPPARAAHPFATAVRGELDALEASGLRRRVRTVPGPGPAVLLEGRRVVAFASNDALGLAGDPRLAAAMAAGARREGAGAGAARLVTGARPAHEALEEAAARLVRAEAALLVGSGFAANASLLPALAGPGDLVVSDRRNHASLVDGCRLSRARVVVLDAGDAAAVRRALAGRARRRLVVVEGLHSTDGTVPDLAALDREARRAGALLVVDDAHGHGVLGPGGRGAVAAAGLRPGPGLLLVGTLGKAFGGFGAFVAWTAEGVDLLRHRLRAFVFSTALPPGVAAAGLEGMRVAAAEPWRRRRALALARRLRRALRRAGVPAGDGPGHIVPVVVGGAREAVAVSGRLLAGGFWVPALRPPTVPPGTARLRLAVTAAHDAAAVDALAAALGRALREVPR